MTRPRAALARIVGMFTKHRGDDELREELESHLEMETAEYIRRGMPPDGARRRCHRKDVAYVQAYTDPVG